VVIAVIIDRTKLLLLVLVVVVVIYVQIHFTVINGCGDATRLHDVCASILIALSGGLAE